MVRMLKYCCLIISFFYNFASAEELKINLFKENYPVKEWKDSADYDFVLKHFNMYECLAVGEAPVTRGLHRIILQKENTRFNFSFRKTKYLKYAIVKNN